jgi:hypothetical protein
MNDFDQLKQSIDEYIRVNGRGYISGPALNSILKAMVDTLGAATGKTLLITLDGSELTNTPSADTYGNKMYIFEDSSTGELHRWITIQYDNGTYDWKDLGLTEEQLGDLHGGGFYNLDQLHPLVSGYYTLEMAVDVVANDPALTDNDRKGIIIQYFDGDVWKFAFFPKPYNSIDFANPDLWMTFVDPYQAASDHQRAETDHLRATGDHSTAVADHTQAGADHATAVADHSTAVSDNEKAESDHQRAETDHLRATGDHSTAAADHTQAGTDHFTAVVDHTQAGADHATAVADHSTAVADHKQAAADHTQSGNDHTRADSDHSTAVADHNQAGTDHTAAQQATDGANTAAGLATEKSRLAADAAMLANQKAELADTKAQYAEQQGDYAKSEIDGAKGDFESLDARFDHVDEISMYFEETGLGADPALVDEYRRVLAVAYQAIADLKAMMVRGSEVIASVSAVIADAQAAIINAEEKTALAANAAAYANEQGNYARAKADEIEDAKGAYRTLGDRLDAMQRTLEQAVYFHAENH